MKLLFLILTCAYSVLAQDSVKFCQPGFEICKNDGLCLVVDNQNVLCICTFGFGGTFCEDEVVLSTTTTTTKKTATSVTKVSFCSREGNICKNGGLCLLLNNESAICNCAIGFSGSTCENATISTELIEEVLEEITSAITQPVTVPEETTSIAITTPGETTIIITAPEETTLTIIQTTMSPVTQPPTTTIPSNELPICQSMDDPHIRTFDQKNFYNFMFRGSPYLMFTDYDQIKVTTGFIECNGGWSGATCHCGVHITMNDTTIYLDTCGIASNSQNLKFFSFVISKGISNLNCDTKIVPGEKEFDDTWWITEGNTITINGKFFCAKSLSGSVIIRTNHPDKSKNIYLRILTNSIYTRSISQVEIRASSFAFNNSGGLCGLYDKNATNDQFVLIKNQNRNNVRLTDVNEMANFWRLKTLSEFSFTKLTINECPCDTNFASSKNTCDILLSECLQKFAGLPIVRQNYIRPEVAPLAEADIVKGCHKFVGQLNGKISQNQIVQLFQACITDLKNTGDPIWAENLLEIGKNWEFENRFTPTPLKTTASSTRVTPVTTIATTITTLNREIYLCSTNYQICQNGGQCLLINGAYITCRCTIGFYGNFCERKSIQIQH